MGIFNRVLDHLAKGKSEQSSNQRLLTQIDRYAPLIHLQDERTLLEVRLPDQTESFQTMVIGVDIYHQQLLIDELSPALSNPEELIGQVITLRHQQGQQMLQLQQTITGWDQHNRCLNLTLPESVHYFPRRQQPRLQLAGSTMVSVFIDPLYGTPMHGSIINISSGGIRVLVTGDFRQNLHKHKPLRQCRFTLDNGIEINCRGRVKAYSYQGRPYRRTEISIVFEQLSPQDQLELDSYIGQLSQAA